MKCTPLQMLPLLRIFEGVVPGEVQERLNWPPWKGGILARVSWVRIPPSPLAIPAKRDRGPPSLLFTYSTMTVTATSATSSSMHNPPLQLDINFSVLSEESARCSTAFHLK